MISTVGKEKLWEILREEYGITTEEELDRELENMERLDISVFTTKYAEEEAV